MSSLSADSAAEGSPPHLPTAEAAPATSGAEEQPSLRTFVLEVGAGRTTGAAAFDDRNAEALSFEPPQRRQRKLPFAAAANYGKVDPTSGKSPCPPEQQLEGIELPDVASDDASSCDSAAAVFQTAIEVAPPAAGPAELPSLGTNEPSPRQRSLPAWFASLSVHLTMFALLATVSLATVQPPLLLEMTFTPSPPELEEVVFDAPIEEIVGDVGAIVADNLPVEIIDPGVAPLGGLGEGIAEVATGFETPGDTGPAGSPGGGGPLGDVGALFGEPGGMGTGRFGSGLGGAPTAKFFGAEIEGRRIVFVLDNSGSMQGGRLETVIAELLSCVDRLRDNQEFYVIFHSDTVYPMFYPDPVDRYLRPTKANKRMLAAWLDSVELCLGDSVEDAILAAAMIEPDTVFLLSDGRIQGENKFRVLLNGKARNFPIHTFAVGMNGSVAGRRNLQQIADANGGKFSESEIPPEMRDLSRERLRPYHNETPGPVWGRNVKPFKFGK